MVPSQMLVHLEITGSMGSLESADSIFTAEVVFGRGSKQENKNAFDSLYTHKAEIESVLGTTLQWNRGDDIKSSKVFIQLNNVSIENETEWLQMANFHADWTKKFYDVIVPYIKR